MKPTFILVIGLLLIDDFIRSYAERVDSVHMVLVNCRDFMHLCELIKQSGTILLISEVLGVFSNFGQAPCVSQ